MDPSKQQVAEEHDDFFHRLEQENRIVSYFFIIPSQCKLAGTLIEEGMLLRDFKHAQNPDILLFFETGVARGAEETGFTFLEVGRRTRYLESVARKARNVVFWKNEDQLHLAVKKQAIAIIEAHGSPSR